jgi:hypothetical protein
MPITKRRGWTAGSARKGKVAKMAAGKVALGDFRLERDTKNTHVFVQDSEDEGGRALSFYVPKSKFGEGAEVPAVISITLEVK